MTAEEPVLREHGNSYNIFILVLTIFSLALMVLQLLPVSQAEKDLLTVYDNAVCLVFLVDFAFNLAGSRPRSAYFIGARGWLDLIGSVPAFGFFQLGALLRLARLSRLARISKLLGGNSRKELISDVIHNRGQYAMFITVLLAGIVLSTASIIVLEFESRSPDANIKTGGDALWWSIVTITTVGYGDRYPVTMGGRITATFVMVAGIGIIGALASILASLLVSPTSSEETEPEEPGEGAADVPSDAVTPSATAGAAEAVPRGVLAATELPIDAAAADAILVELAGLRAEVAALRESLPGPPG